MVHAELTPEDIGDGRVIVIGDVHGCLCELKALLEKCAVGCHRTLPYCPVTISLCLLYITFEGVALMQLPQL